MVTQSLVFWGLAEMPKQQFSWTFCLIVTKYLYCIFINMVVQTTSVKVYKCHLNLYQGIVETVLQLLSCYLDH